MNSLRVLGLAVLVAVAGGCAAAVPAAPFKADRCEWTGRYRGNWVFLESDQISAYFEVGNIDAYRRAIPEPLGMPDRPLIRVVVLDFYGMANGATYLESVVSVLARRDGELGWYVVTMPVTNGDSCWGGRYAWGYPKIVRRITLERSIARFVGTSYAEDAVTPDFRLTLDSTAPGANHEAWEVLRFVSPMPNLTLHQGRVLAFGGYQSPVYDLERVQPSVYRVHVGTPRLDYPVQPGNLLTQLGAGRALAGYWLKTRSRWSITPRS